MLLLQLAIHMGSP